MQKYDKSIIFLNDYFMKVKQLVENNIFSKKVDNYLNKIKNRLFIDDLNTILEIEQFLNNKDDSKLYELYLNVSYYNELIRNSKVKNVVENVEKDIDFDEINIGIDDILDFLHIDINDIDNDLSHDLKIVVKDTKKIQQMKEFATFISDINTPQYRIFDKIKDKNLLLSVLINSNIDNVKNIIDCFKDDNNNYRMNNLNKVVENIPTIFIVNFYLKNPKYKLPCNYANFMGNMHLLKDNNVETNYVYNYPVFLINNIKKNESSINKIKDAGIDVNNIIKYCANILTIKPDVVINNINLLKYYNIPFTNDDNNNGYTILGMVDLDKKIDYLIENDLWKQENSFNHDIIDLIRALIIKDDYLKWKNNYKYDILNTVPNLFCDKILNQESINDLYQRYNFLKRLDSDYLVNGCYQINGARISKHKLLKTLNNLIKPDSLALKNSLNYGTNLDNEVISGILSELEMGDDSVKLSKGV